MGSSSPASPPWMSELVANNHKIIRNMWHSTADAILKGDFVGGDNDGFNKEGGNHKKQVVEPKSTSMNVTEKRTKTTTTMASVVQEHMQRSKTNKRKTSTEKSSPIRDESGFMEDVDAKTKDYLRNGGGEEESILEYGPGIVRKLRSRYQSLALRQYSSRPSLRRSASLENVLDADASVGEEIKIKPEDESDGVKDDNKTYMAGMTKSKSASAVLEIKSQSQNLYEKKPTGPRGRAAVSERRDRMRRARSVDVLQRTKQEEEILEKFKAVVLPKEEIVIIEVSKPRSNQNGVGSPNANTNSGSYYLATDDKVYPTQLLISQDSASPGLAENLLRARSFISPEHELPPQDIVRETARIFEKNQENNKRIAQALRLSKSPSLQSPSSPAATPTSPIPPPTMPQGVQSSENKSPSINLTNAKPPSVLGLKQVGIIRPTVCAKSSENVGKPVEANPTMISPILSSSQNAYKAFLQHNSNSNKPPLSPKPLFTSSPKVSSNPSSAFTKSPSFESQPAVTEKRDSEKPMPTPSPIVNGKLEDIKKPLKHVPNSFTISSANKEIMPASVPTVQKSSPSPQMPPVPLSRVILSQSPAPMPPDQKGKVTAKITETPGKLSTASIREERKSPSPQPQPQPPAVPARKIVTVPTVAPPLPPTRHVETNGNSNNSSQLRAHQTQKQKTSQGGGASMVFNFTARSNVPDYIEDDGMHNGRLTLAGTVCDESADDVDSAQVDIRLIKFVGANVIINGKSSIQKKPKSTKMSISINEDATTTYEYPSETSMLAEEDANEKDMLGHKSPNIINNSGSGLSSYTPKLQNDYQLGSFDSQHQTPKKSEAKKENSEVIEDYLKPDAEDTTWSNEITADILF